MESAHGCGFQDLWFEHSSGEKFDRSLKAFYFLGRTEIVNIKRIRLALGVTCASYQRHLIYDDLAVICKNEK